MDRASQQFFAGAAFSGDQHSRIGAGNHMGLGQLLLHDRAAGHDIGAPVLIGGTEARDAQGFLHLIEQFLLVHRFGEEAEGAHLRGLYGIGDGAMGGQHDDLQARPAVLQFLQQRDAVHRFHAQVRDHQIRTETAGGRDRLRAALDRLNVVALGAQPDGQKAQQARIIIDDQNSGFAFAGSRHYGVPPGTFGLFKARSILAMASSFACASSSSRCRRALSSSSPCSRRFNDATRSRSL